MCLMLMLPVSVGSIACGTGCRQLEHMRLGAGADTFSLGMLMDCATLLAALPMVLMFVLMVDL